MTRFTFITFWLLVLFSIPVLGSQSPEDVLFDTNFESGFAGAFHFNEVRDTWILDLGADNGEASLPASYRRTFFFRASQTAGVHLKIQIEQVYWNCGNVPIASYDAVTWFRLDPDVNNDTHIELNVPIDEDQVFFSYTYPYTVSDKNRFLESIENDRRVEINIIGQAKESSGLPEWARSIELLTIQHTGGDTQKMPIWIHARIHPGEVPPSFMVEGFVNYLLESDNLEARWLLDHCIFYIVPMVNPSGVYLGNYRTNAESENLEAVWCQSPQLADQSPFPEVNAMKTILDYINNDIQPVAIALNLHATMTQSDEGHFHFKHISPSVSQDFESIEDRWIQRFDEAATQFNNINPRESQLSSCAFVESYLWNHFREETMALTLEAVYMNRDSDDGMATPADFRQLGSEMARAVQLYFKPSSSRFSPEETAVENLVLTSGKYTTQVSISTASTTVEKTMLPHSKINLEVDLTRGESLQIESDYQIHSYLTQGNLTDSLSMLLGNQPLQKNVILPHIPKDDWTATLVATNQSENLAAFQLFPEGDTSNQTEFQVASGASLRLNPFDFGENWLTLTSPERVWTYQLIFARAGVVTANLNLLDQDKTTVYFPHLPSDKTNFWFGFVLVNTSQESQAYRMEAFDGDGLPLGSKDSVLNPAQRIVALLSNSWPELQDSASWIRITSQVPLQGLMLFGTQNGQSLAGLPLRGEPDTHFHFPVLMESEDSWQGIALLNTGRDVSSLKLTFYGVTGNLISTTTRSLAAGARLVTTLEALIMDHPSQLSSIRIDSSQPLIALELLGDKAFEQLDGFLLEPIENAARPVNMKKNILPEEELVLR